MSKKILLATAMIVPSLAVGGLWVYQASLFESSISQQVSEMQETLKTYGVLFHYDDLRVSRYLFKAQFVNPAVSGTMRKLGENRKGVKAFEGLEKLDSLEGTLSIKGEMTACFSPIFNTVTVKTDGESHLRVQGPLEFDLSMPKPKEASFVIQRKDYDLFGKNSFLSLDNIKKIYSDSKGLSLFLDGQKFLDIKDATSQISLGWKDKALDISITSDTHQVEFFKLEKGIKGKLEGLDDFNASILDGIEMAAILGGEDQKISASFHVNDLMSYINDIKLIFADASSNLNPQVFEKLVPEGMVLEVKDYSVENKVYQSSMKMSVGKLNGYLPIKLSGDFKVTDQWPGYWNNYFKVILNNLNNSLADRKLPAELISVLKSEDISAKVMPQLQSFGKILFSVDFDIPASLSFTEGKGSFELKSDFYDLGVVGVLNQEGGSVKLKTRNASSLMADLETYITRMSQPFSQSYPLEVQNLKGFLKGGRTVLDKILEPSGAVQQSLHIQINKEGLKIGNYDLVQILGMFGEAMGKE